MSWNVHFSAQCTRRHMVLDTVEISTVIITKLNLATYYWSEKHFRKIWNEKLLFRWIKFNLNECKWNIKYINLIYVLYKSTLYKSDSAEH